MIEPFDCTLLDTHEAFRSNGATAVATNENKTIARTMTCNEKLAFPQISRTPQMTTNVIYFENIKQNIERKRRAVALIPESKATSRPSNQRIAKAVVRFAYD